MKYGYAQIILTKCAVGFQTTTHCYKALVRNLMCAIENSNRIKKVANDIYHTALSLRMNCKSMSEDEIFETAEDIRNRAGNIEILADKLSDELAL